MPEGVYMCPSKAGRRRSGDDRAAAGGGVDDVGRAGAEARNVAVDLVDRGNVPAIQTGTDGVQ
jgi:hypothetical protein